MSIAAKLREMRYPGSGGETKSTGKEILAKRMKEIKLRTDALRSKLYDGEAGEKLKATHKRERKDKLTNRWMRKHRAKMRGHIELAR